MDSRGSAAYRESAKEALIRESYGENLKKWRKRQGFASQAKLAKKAGVPVYVVGALERGAKPIDLEEIVKICQGMNVAPEVFLEDVHRYQLDQALAIAARLGTGSQPEESGSTTTWLELEQSFTLVWEKLGRVVLNLLAQPQALLRGKNMATREQELGGSEVRPRRKK